MHALIIEDDELIAIAIEDILRDCDFSSFAVAVSFEDAIVAATEREPELITADVELSPGSGIDAVQTICARSSIPVIFITGRGNEVHQRMPDHLVVGKPFGRAHVHAAVRQVMCH